MSWQLLNFNYMLDYTPPFYLDPDADVDVDADNLFEGDIISRLGDAGRQYFAKDSESGKIMYNYKGYHELKFSDDWGETWSDPTDYPNFTQGNWSDESCQDMDYFPATGRWVATIYASSVRETGWQFSDDDGETWGDVDPGSYGAVYQTCRYSVNSLIDSQGDLVFSARSSGNDCWFFKYDNPGPGATEDRIVMASLIAYNGHTMLEIGNCYISIDAHSSGDFYWNRVDKNLTTSELRSSDYFENGRQIHSNSGSWGNHPTGRILGWESDDGGGQITLKEITEDTLNTDTLATQSIVFPQNCTYHCLVYSWEVDLWILGALAGTDSDQLMLKSSRTGEAGTWSTGTTTVTLSHEADTTYSGQIAFRKGSSWYYAYREHTTSFAHLDKFEMGIEVILPNSLNPLYQEIQSQVPEIFYRSDDLIGSLALRDIGSAAYANKIIGAVDLEWPGLVDDAGTSIDIDVFDSAGVLITDDIPTSANHAHVFVVERDALIVDLQGDDYWQYVTGLYKLTEGDGETAFANSGPGTEEWKNYGGAGSNVVQVFTEDTYLNSASPLCHSEVTGVSFSDGQLQASYGAIDSCFDTWIYAGLSVLTYVFAHGRPGAGGGGVGTWKQGIHLRIDTDGSIDIVAGTAYSSYNRYYTFSSAAGAITANTLHYLEMSIEDNVAYVFVDGAVITMTTNDVARAADFSTVPLHANDNVNISGFNFHNNGNSPENFGVGTEQATDTYYAFTRFTIGAARNTVAYTAPVIPTYDFPTIEVDDLAPVSLLSSGDMANPELGGFKIEMDVDETIRYGAHNGTEWEYLSTVDTYLPDDPHGIVVTVNHRGNNRGIVGIYFYGEERAYSDDIAIPIVSGSNRQMLLGNWQGEEDALNSGYGITLDYYAQIRQGSLQLWDLIQAIVDEFGGTVVQPEPPPTPPPPPPGESPFDAVFLVHADSISDAYTLPQAPGTPLYGLPNSAGNDNTIHTEVQSGRISTDSKFGAGAGVATGRSQTSAGYTPFDIALWNEGHLQGFNRREFNYDIQVKSDSASGFAYAGSNAGLQRRGGRFYVFGGITIAITQEPGSPTLGRITLYIGGTLDQAIAGIPYQLVLQYTRIPGYIAGGYNHIGVTRVFDSTYNDSIIAAGPLTLGGYLRRSMKFHVYLNGNEAGQPGVPVNLTGTSIHYCNIHQAGQWLFGSSWYVHSGGYAASRYTPPSKWDEARLILDGVVYNASFSPPAAPYT